MTNIHNFKMSHYLHLSCTYNGQWLLPCVLVLSLLASLAMRLYCHQASVVHLDVEDFSEELLQCLLCNKDPAPKIGPFRAWKPTILIP